MGERDSTANNLGDRGFYAFAIFFILFILFGQFCFWCGFDIILIFFARVHKITSKQRQQNNRKNALGCRGIGVFLLSFYVFIAFILMVIAIGMRSGPTPSFGTVDNKCLTYTLFVLLFPGMLLCAIQAFYYWIDGTDMFCDFKLWQCQISNTTRFNE